jgi:hypothetical protein
MLLYLTKPEIRLRALVDILKEYGTFSGYKINLLKSIIRPSNRAAMQNHILDQLFSWKPQKMTYLGLQIPSEIIKTYQLNYTPLLKKVGEELDRFLYLFQTLPFPITKV